MKKIWIVLITIIFGIIILIFVNKWYYPALPINSITPKEAIQKLNTSTQELVEIGNDESVTWYITRNSENGILKVDEAIKQFISNYGWEFKEKDGSGLFFEKNGTRLILNTKMWTKHYILVKIPSHFKE